MLPFDFIAEKNADDAKITFIRKFVEAKEEIVSFVDNRLGWNQAGEFSNYFKGSFNLSLAVRNGKTNEHVLIRFPFMGKVHTPWREAKVKNEVMTMQYLSEHTSLPIPHIYAWGLTEESPQQLGPFIIEEFMEGENLGDVLKKPTEDETELAVLDPNIDNKKLDIVYEQIAGFMLELSRLEFSRIGAIGKDPLTGEWTISEPPLTYDMNEAVAFAGFPADHFAATTSPFSRASDYFTARAQCLQVHLETQRNIGFEDENITWNRYIARQSLSKLIPFHGSIDDSGPFRLFCDDLRPSNMLVDRETMRITAILDLEFTNAMPAQLAHDPPWWLLLGQPGISVSEDKEEFLRLFEPRLEQFISALERVEATEPRNTVEPQLSVQMRNAWKSGRFWFNLAMRSSYDCDSIFWKTLQDETREPVLDITRLSEKEEFLARKKSQFNAYWAEKQRDERFK